MIIIIIIIKPTKGNFFSSILSGGLTLRWGKEGGGEFERGSLLILARMMVSVLHRDLERKVEMLKYMKLEVMQPRFTFFCNFVVIE